MSNDDPVGGGGDDDQHDGSRGRPTKPPPPLPLPTSLPPPPFLVLTIRSATYGPSTSSGEDRRRRPTRDEHDDDNRNGDNDATESSSSSWERRWSRDVTHEVATCLRRGSMHFDDDDQKKENDDSADVGHYTNDCSNVVKIRSVNRDGMMATLIPLELPVDGGMNVMFGDPCPGTTKRLTVEYTIEEATTVNSSSSTGRFADRGVVLLHRMSFAEQEPVVLRRHVHRGGEEKGEGRSKQEEDEEGKEPSNHSVVAERGEMMMITTDTVSKPVGSFAADPAYITEWAEPVLPLILPWLTLAERVACRQVSGTWRKVLQTWGLATTIDNNNSSNIGSVFGGGIGSDPVTVPVLRGLLLHSFASLQSLYVSGMTDLQKADLHPALTSMKRLRAIDISYCRHLDDETLQVMASPKGNIRETLHVLYIKGLRKCTDVGLVALAACQQLRVLDVSGIQIMTDASGTCLGQSLVQLRAWYGRDNYHITGATVAALVENCPHLEQLTLWGCHRLAQLHPFNDSAVSESPRSRLVLLNMWGCHSLNDDAAAQAIVNMSQLRTLIVSECHKLTDRFVFSTCVQAPGLQHLMMRYCPRITDEGVHAIARSLKSLFSLDLSCCPLITSAGLDELLLRSSTHLVELRIARCRGLDLVTQPEIHRRHRRHEAGELGDAGNVILKALRGPECHLALLDVSTGFSVHRGHHHRHDDYHELQLFASAVESLGFTHLPNGFFARRSNWDTTV